MAADLHEVFVIVNGHQQQCAILFTFTGANSPTPRDCKGIIEDVLIAGSSYRDHRELNVAFLLKTSQDGFHPLCRGGIQNACVIVDVPKRVGWWQRRDSLSKNSGRACD